MDNWILTAVMQKLILQSYTMKVYLYSLEVRFASRYWWVTSQITPSTYPTYGLTSWQGGVMVREVQREDFSHVINRSEIL